jgi:hypothetical protein
LAVKSALKVQDKSSAKDFREVIEASSKALGDGYYRLLTMLESAGSLRMAPAISRCVLFSMRPPTVHETEAV